MLMVLLIISAFWIKLKFLFYIIMYGNLCIKER